MAYNKKTWLARLGQGLNKFSIDGATPVPIINQPDSVTQQGDALSAGNLNDLEQRIANAFDDVEESKADKSTTKALQSQINQQEARIENLEQKAGDYTTVQYRGTNAVPTDKAKNGLVEKIVGKTRAWNQLAKAISSTNWEAANLATVSYSDGVATLMPTYQYGRLQQYINYIANHKMLVSAKIKLSSSANYDRVSASIYGVDNIVDGTIYSAQTTDWQTISFITYATSSASGNRLMVTDGRTSDWGTIQIKEYVCYDLTLIFGPGNEPSTVADALAQLPALGQYNAYDAGSLVDTEVSGVRSVGRNLFNKDDFTLFDGYVASSGVLTASAGGEKTFICKALPLQAYYLIRKESYGRIASYTDNPSGGDVGTIISTSYSTALTFTTLAETTYLAITFRNNTGNTFTYEEDIEGMYLGYGTSGSFTPYKTDTLSLPETVTLRSAGSVAEVYDLVTGEKTNPIRRMTFGDDTYWTKSNDGVYFTQDVSGLYDDSVVPLCPPYIGKSKANGNSGAYDKGDMTCCFRQGPSNDRFFIRDDYAFVTMNYTAAQFKEYIKGKQLQFALATPDDPTQLTPVIDNTIQTEGGGTIDTIQTQTPVIDNCLDVGYLTV